MDAFESVVSTLLKRSGYWTDTSFKVELTKEEKVAIERPSSPRWEIDVVAYSGARNELLIVECKSYLDSPGVRFDDLNGTGKYTTRYKLFNDTHLRDTVINRLKMQLVEQGHCADAPKACLCLATGKFASATDRERTKELFDKKGWKLFDDQWIVQNLEQFAELGYENDVAIVVAKLLMRNKNNWKNL